MKRCLLALPALLLATGLAIASLSIQHDQGPVYSLAAVRGHLAHDPRHWAGRSLLVRGEVVPCLAIPGVGGRPCAALAERPADPRPTPWGAAIDPLPVVHAGLDPVLGRLRRLPLLGDLLPAPQVLRWGAVATYRVRLRACANSLCGTGVCYEAVLLDPAP